MTNEIKELIDNIKKIIKENRKNDFNHIILQSTSMEQLLDYITNLQQIIDKATNYINKNWGSWCSDHYTNATNVVNILNGGDEE